MADKRFSWSNKRGFTLVEVLFSLTITLLILFNLVPILKVIVVKDDLKVTMSNYSLGANQLSKILYTAKDIEVSDCLTYKDQEDKTFTISLHNHRLVKEPGFDILIHNVNDLSFYQIDKKIYMDIEDDSNTYTYLIGYDYQIEVVDESEELENEMVPVNP